MFDSALAGDYGTRQERAKTVEQKEDPSLLGSFSLGDDDDDEPTRPSAVRSDSLYPFQIDGRKRYAHQPTAFGSTVSRTQSAALLQSVPRFTMSTADVDRVTQRGFDF